MMDWIEVVGGACAAAVLIVPIGILFCIFRAVLDPLRSVPGPFWARFSRLWYLRRVSKGQQHLDEVQLHKQYGSIVRLAPNQYSISDISAVRAIYDHGSKYIKSDFYLPFGAPVGRLNIFQDPNPASHAQTRRKVASFYTMTAIVNYEPSVNSCIKTYMGQLEQFTKTTEPIEMAAWMQYYAFDVIGAITIGNPYGFLDHGCDFPGIINEQRKSQTIGTHVGTFAGSWHPYLVAVMSRLSSKPPFVATYRYAVTSLEKKKQEMQNSQGFEQKNGPADFAERLLFLQEQGKLDDYDVMATIRSNIAAGSDSTGGSLAAIMYHITCNPPVLAKLRNEIDGFKAQQEDSNQLISFAQAQQLPYLQACVKEALRLVPAVGMQLPRVVPKGGALLAGRHFPGGTVVGVNSWVIHRQPELFGSDADQFRPERWLEDDQKAREMDKCLFTFGAGSRTCIGRNISMLEMVKLVPELVTRYDFELVQPDRDMEYSNRFFVYLKYHCRVKMRKEKLKHQE